jgi:hypothetical protein
MPKQTRFDRAKGLMAGLSDSGASWFSTDLYQFKERKEGGSHENVFQFAFCNFIDL